MFFFEKKNQKTFANLQPYLCQRPCPSFKKIFAELFLKSDRFLSGARHETC
jgi:hypothetical protein